MVRKKEFLPSVLTRCRLAQEIYQQLFGQEKKFGTADWFLENGRNQRCGNEYGKNDSVRSFSSKFEQGLYYATTKILNRTDTGRFRKPLLLPQAYPVVDKLVMEEHQAYGHAGVQFLIGKLREKYWKTRRTVSRIIKGCVICKRIGDCAYSSTSRKSCQNR